MGLSIAELYGTIELDDKFSEAATKVFEIAEKIGETLLELGERGAEIRDVAEQFEVMNKALGNSADTLQRLQTAFEGTISDFDLMKTTNTALGQGLKLTGDQFQLVGEAARVLAARTGGDALQAYNALTTAMATGRDRMLRQVQIHIDATSALANYAEAIGKTTSQLTQREQVLAKQQAILEKLNEVIETSGKKELDFHDRLKQVHAGLENFVNQLSVAVATSPQLNAAFDAFNKVLQDTLKWMTANVRIIQEWINVGLYAAIEAIDSLVSGIGHVKDVFDGIIIGFENAKLGALEFASEVIQLNLSMAQLAKQAPGGSVLAKMFGLNVDKEIADSSAAVKGLGEEIISTKKSIEDTVQSNNRWHDTLDSVHGALGKVKTAMDNAGNALVKIKEAHGAAGKAAEEHSKAEEAAARKAEEAAKKYQENLIGLEGEYSKVMAGTDQWAVKLAEAHSAASKEVEKFKNLFIEAQGRISDAQHAATLKIIADIEQEKINQIEYAQLIAKGAAEDKGYADARAREQHITQELLDQAKTKTEILSGVLQDIGSIFAELGIKSDSFFGRLISGATKAAEAGGALQRALLNIRDKNDPNSANFGKDSTGDKLAAAASAAQGVGSVINIFQTGAHSGAAAGALSGAATGSAFGAQFGGYGAAIGGAAGLVTGIAGALFGHDDMKQLEEMRNKFIELHGGLRELGREAQAAGADLSGLFNAQNVTDYNQAVNDLSASLDPQKQAWDKVNEAVQRYGFTVDELGPKMQAQQLDETVGQLLSDYKLLTASGIDQATVLERMGPAMNAYLDSALKAGASIPENMRPILQSLVDSGQATDEFGNKLTSLDRVDFTASLSEGIQHLIDHIDTLIGHMNDIPNIERTVTISKVIVGGHSVSPEEAHQLDVPGFADGGIAVRPTLGIFGEAGPEALIPLDKYNGGNNEEIVAEIRALQRVMLDVLPRAVRDAMKKTA